MYFEIVLVKTGEYEISSSYANKNYQAIYQIFRILIYVRQELITTRCQKIMISMVYLPRKPGIATHVWVTPSIQIWNWLMRWRSCSVNTGQSSWLKFVDGKKDLFVILCQIVFQLLIIRPSIVQEAVNKRKFCLFITSESKYWLIIR